MAVRVLQGAQLNKTMRRSLEKKWIVQLKEDDGTKMINRDDSADILLHLHQNAMAKTFFTHLTNYSLFTYFESSNFY